MSRNSSAALDAALPVPARPSAASAALSRPPTDSRSTRAAATAETAPGSRAARAALRGVDSQAEISVDLERREVTVASEAGAEGFADALREAGFEGLALPA